MDTPGLLKREVVIDVPCDHMVMVRELWDLTVPDCPAISVRGGRVADDIQVAECHKWMTRIEARELGLLPNKAHSR